MTITHKKVSSEVSVCTWTTSVVVYRLYVLCVLICVNFCHLRPSTLYFLLSIGVISIYGFSVEVRISKCATMDEAGNKTTLLGIDFSDLLVQHFSSFCSI